MFKAFFWSGKREWSWNDWKHVIRAYVGMSILLTIILLQIKNSLLFNDWNEWIFDAFEVATVRPASELWWLMLIFAGIALGDVFLHTSCKYVGRVFTLHWREALMERYVPSWKQTPHTVEGAAARIQNDTQLFAEIVESLGIDVLRAFLLVCAFVPRLWHLGAEITFGPIEWQGALVTLAIVLSLSGVGISWFVARKLPTIQYQNKKNEAAWRDHLVFAEHQRSFLNAGRGWQNLFSDVVFNYHVMYRHTAYFDVWHIFYDKLMMITPYLVGVTGMASGGISIGEMARLIHTFGQVQNGFSVALRNWTQVTDLRSVYVRLRELEQSFVTSVPDADAHAPEKSAEVVDLPHMMREKRAADERRARAIAESNSA